MFNIIKMEKLSVWLSIGYVGSSVLIRVLLLLSIDPVKIRICSAVTAHAASRIASHKASLEKIGLHPDELASSRGSIYFKFDYNPENTPATS